MCKNCKHLREVKDLEIQEKCNCIKAWKQVVARQDKLLLKALKFLELCDFQSSITKLMADSRGKLNTTQFLELCDFQSSITKLMADIREELDTTYIRK